jgi:hypothetical protein
MSFDSNKQLPQNNLKEQECNRCSNKLVLLKDFINHSTELLKMIFNTFKIYFDKLLLYNSETDKMLALLICNICKIFIRICFTLFQLYVIFNIACCISLIFMYMLVYMINLF